MEKSKNARTSREAWIKVWNDWKGGRREVLNIRATLFEQDVDDKLIGYYRCIAYRPYNNGGLSVIESVSERDVIKFI